MLIIQGEKFYGIGKRKIKQKLLDTLVQKIYIIYDNEMIINCNYSNDKRRIVYDDLESLITNQKCIDELMDGNKNKVEVSTKTLVDMLEDDENAKFFCRKGSSILQSVLLDYVVNK